MNYINKNSINSNEYCYRNIPNSKNSKFKYVLDYDELDEYYKCRKDIEYFISKLDINLYEYQKDILKFWNENRFSILLSSRQMGISMLNTLLSLYFAVFEQKKIALFSIKHEIGRELFNKFKIFYSKLPMYLKPGIIKSTSEVIEFDNNSSIQLVNSNNYKGKLYDIFIIDNISNMSDNNKKILIKEIVPLYASINNSRIIIMSSDIHFDLFYKFVQDSEIFKVKKVYWYDHPQRNEKWKEDTIKNIGEENFMHEYNLSFKIKDKYFKI